MLKENMVYQSVITGYADNGSGVTRIDGMVVFVRETVRGETVRILIEHVGHNAAWGKAVELIKASPCRTQPDCPYYSRCGGCQFRHMDYSEELFAKQNCVESALKHIGGTEAAVSAVWGAEHPERYRNKVQLPVGIAGIGYYRERSHQIIDISDCLLQPEADTDCITALRRWMDQFSVPAYQEGTGEGVLRHLYLRTNRIGQILCCLVINGSSLPHEKELIAALRSALPNLLGIVLSVNTKKTNVILGSEFRILWGQDWLEETLCGHSFRLSVPSFFQVNLEQTEILYDRILDFANLSGDETIADLYCGIGTISLTLAAHAKRVIGAEIVPQAVKNAKENARRNGLDHKATFYCGDASKLALQMEKHSFHPEVVVVDPPRKGLASAVLEAVAQMNPERIIYVSCNPATLARDLKGFSLSGYFPDRVEAVDLFPRTANVETVVLLRRKPNAADHSISIDSKPDDSAFPLVRNVTDPEINV